MIVNGVAQAIGAEDDGVKGLLYSEGAGGNVFVEHMPQSPNRCVGVYSRPGPEASSIHPYDEPHLQIIVRGDEDPQWAIDMWWAVYSWLHAKRHIVLPDGTQLVYALVLQSGPVHLDPDENRRYRFTMNIKTEIYNPTSERPG